MTPVYDHLVLLDACAEALEWVVETQPATMQAAWDTCPRGDWMGWYAKRVDALIDEIEASECLFFAAVAGERLAFAAGCRAAKDEWCEAEDAARAALDRALCAATSPGEIDQAHRDHGRERDRLWAAHGAARAAVWATYLADTAAPAAVFADAIRAAVPVCPVEES